MRRVFVEVLVEPACVASARPTMPRYWNEDILTASLSASLSPRSFLRRLRRDAIAIPEDTQSRVSDQQHVFASWRGERDKVCDVVDLVCKVFSLGFCS